MCRNASFEEIEGKALGAYEAATSDENWGRKRQERKELSKRQE